MIGTFMTSSSTLSASSPVFVVDTETESHSMLREGSNSMKKENPNSSKSLMLFSLLSQ